MTALEAFNALDNREVSRKEVEHVLLQAKAENNTTIIYRLSKILNDYPQATHFEISVTHYQPQEGLLGVQHTGNYKDALDDCGRLRKGWKFVNGNVVKVEEKPKKADKPKKEKAPQKETKKDKKYKFVVITDNRPSRVIAVFSYTNPNIKDLRESFWKNGEGKYYETTEEGLRNYTFGMGPYPFAEAKKHIEEKYTEGKDFIYFIIEKDGGRDEAISLVEKPKKEAQPKNNKEENPKKLKFSDVEVNKRLIESFTNNSTGENLLFKKDVFGYIFSFSSLEKFMDIEQIYVLYGKDRKKEAEKDFSMMKEEISWTIEHHIKTAKREGMLEVCKKYFLEHLPELLAKGGLWLEAKAKNKGLTAARSIFTKLRKKVWKNIGELAVGKSVENVQDSSKKKVEIDSSKFKKAKVVQQIGDYVKNFFETGNCYVPKGIFPKKREGFKSINLKGVFWLDDLEKEGLAPVKKNGEIFFVKTGLNAPHHEGFHTKKKKQATSIPAPSVTESLRDSSLSEGKDTKKSLSRKKKEENFGLNAPYVPEVSSERFKTLKEAKKYYKEWASENLRGKKVYHKELNKYILFSSKGIDHVLSSNISFDKMKLILQAEEMLKNSHIIAFEEDYKKRDNVKGVYRMSSKAILDKEEISVILTLREGENGVIYYDHKIEEIERSTTPPRKSHANPFCGDSASSEGKDTKKSLSRKKKEENFGLNGPEAPEAPEAPETPETSLPAPRQTLAQQLATRPEVRESFLVADEQMSLFLGSLEKKTKDSLVITLTGKQGSGKTRFAFQFMNALAQRYRVGHASIEEHPESVLYEEKAYQYLNDTALEHITAQDVRSLEELDTMIRTNEVIVIDSFQKMRELAPNFEIDKDLRKKYDGKLFLVIFQQTADGKMRGGSKSQFDGDIILFTETFPDYRENYVYPDKNRYNKRPATELQYSIYEKRMLATAPEDSSLPDPQETTEIDELNFDVL